MRAPLSRAAGKLDREQKLVTTSLPARGKGVGRPSQRLKPTHNQKLIQKVSAKRSSPLLPRKDLSAWPPLEEFGAVSACDQ